MCVRAARAAKAAAQCVLGVADGSRAPILAPKLARIGARVGLREARSTHLESDFRIRTYVIVFKRYSDARAR